MTPLAFKHCCVWISGAEYWINHILSTENILIVWSFSVYDLFFLYHTHSLFPFSTSSLFRSCLFSFQAIFSAKIEKWIAALLWTELYPHPHPDFYVEALTACVTIFGDKAFKGVINVKLWSSHMPAKPRSKSFKLGFSSIWTNSFQVYKLDFEETEEPEIKLPIFTDHGESKGVPEKHLLLRHGLH